MGRTLEHQISPRGQGTAIPGDRIFGVRVKIHIFGNQSNQRTHEFLLCPQICTLTPNMPLQTSETSGRSGAVTGEP